MENSLDLCILYLFLKKLYDYEDGIFLKIKRKFFYHFPNNQSLYRAVSLRDNNLEYAIQIYGNMDLWDTRKITNMSYLFESRLNLKDKIGGWDTSNVINMEGMFFNTLFNQDISGWNTSKVENMSHMFRFAIYFNQDISNWDTSSLRNTKYMFGNTRYFNQDLTKWKIEEIPENQYMFYRTQGLQKSNMIQWKVSL